MTMYCIIETDDGWTIVDSRPDEKPTDTAERLEGVLIDAGPYSSYDDAQEALTALQYEAEDEIPGDVPADRTHDEFYE